MQYFSDLHQNPGYKPIKGAFFPAREPRQVDVSPSSEVDINR